MGFYFYNIDVRNVLGLIHNPLGTLGTACKNGEFAIQVVLQHGYHVADCKRLRDLKSCGYLGIVFTYYYVNFTLTQS